MFPGICHADLKNDFPINQEKKNQLFFFAHNLIAFLTIVEKHIAGFIQPYWLIISGQTCCCNHRM